MGVIYLIIMIIVGILIGKDANSRGMNGFGWGVFTFLIFILAIPVYLIVRQPRKEERSHIA